ncbi:unnamed protein product [Effrenium voratum]|nr:unnamed protein product [Effrenium voratum]
MERDRVRRDEEDEREPREPREPREVRAPMDPMDPRDLKARDPELRLSSPRSSCTANPELSVSEANLDIDCPDSRDSPDLATGEVSDPRRPEPDDWWPAQEEGLSAHQAWERSQDRAGRWGVQWFHQEVEDIDPCSPRTRPGTRQGRRGKEDATGWSSESDAEALGWADLVSRQTWDGSDSEEEQLFAMVGLAQDLDDPEPELEVQGFAPRELWVVFECEEERREPSEEASNSTVDVFDALEVKEDACLNGLVDEVEMREVKLGENEEFWASGKANDAPKCEMLLQASESDDTAETECMSSLAPTECEKGLPDDDDDEHNSEMEDVVGPEDAQGIQAEVEKEEEYSKPHCPPGTAASLLQAVYRGRLARLELSRACAAGTPANWRSLRQTAMVRSSQEVAACLLQAAWRGFQRRAQGAEGRASGTGRRPRPPAGKAAPGPRRRLDAQALSETAGEETPAERQERPRPHSSKSASLSASDRPPSAPRGSGTRRRPSVVELLSQMDAPRSGGLPRLGLSNRAERHRSVPCARAESPRATRRRGLTTLASPRRSWG